MVRVDRLRLRTRLLAFVPTMFVHHIDMFGFYNPVGWGAEAIANGFPLAIWMIVVGILMLRTSRVDRFRMR